MKILSLKTTVLVFIAVLIASAVAVGAPRLVNYQGIVTDDVGNPLTGTYDLTFKIYPDSFAATSPLWTEAHSGVSIDDGLFNVILGTYVTLSEALFADDERWLGVTVGTDSEMEPRMQITSVPWALRATIADSALVAPGGFDQWLQSGNDIYYNDGYVGIGTSSPEAYLHIHTGNDADVQGIKIDCDGENTDFPLRIRCNNDGNATFTDADTKFYIDGDGWIHMPTSTIHDTGSRMEIRPEGGRMILWDMVSYNRFEIYGANNLDVMLNTNGTSYVHGHHEANFGIGTTGPQEQLDVDGAIRIGTTANTNSGAMRWTGSDFEGYNGASWLSLTSGAGWTVSGGDMYSSLPGKVRIGTTSFSGKWKLGVESTVDTTAIYGKSYTGMGVVGHASTTSMAGFGVYGTHGGTTNIGALGGGQFAVYGYGDCMFTNGTTTVDVLEIAGGSDLSENFDIMSHESGIDLLPGMVVSIDPENPGLLEISSEAYDTKVAGIVSGAGGINPGMLMGQKGSEADGANPVALTGRVYCFVDASNCAVMPGDLLTTSGTPGHAMKVSDHSKAHGAILGKAMSSLDSGTGLVLVLVTLQ